MIVTCKQCEARVDAELIAHYESFDPEDGPPSKYSFLRCQTCEPPFLVLQEHYAHGWDDPFLLYPAEKISVSSAYPSAIQTSYAEAVACFNGKAFTAAAIMCRKTLEGVCAEHGVTGKSLVTALNKLKETGVIEQPELC